MNNYTHVSIILDGSGSMSSVLNDTIGGFNQYIKSQKELPGKCTVSLTQFNSTRKELYSFVDLKFVNLLDASSYRPMGSTALLDAIGVDIQKTKAQIGELSDTQKPDRVIIVILTDGEENASREFTREQIFSLISEMKEKSWDFVFLGANQDAIQAGTSLGINSKSSMTYSTDKLEATFNSLSEYTTKYRSVSKDEAVSVSFSNDDRTKVI